MKTTSTLITRTIGTPRAMQLFFDRVAPVYRWLTNNPMWRGSLIEMSRHFPPSAANLTLLDVGCGHGNSAREFLTLRSDVRALGIDFSAVMLKMAQRMTPASMGHRLGLTQGDAARLPLADSSIDAITGHSVYYMLGHQAGFLRECLRVLRPGGRLILLDPALRPFPTDILQSPHSLRIKLAVMSWHAVSRMHERLTLAEMAHRLEQAGFVRVLAENAVQGYGVLSRGEKPYAAGSTPVERVQQTAAPSAEEPTTDLMPIPAVSVPITARGSNVFLLIKQTPNKPMWALSGDEMLHWDAVVTHSTAGGRSLVAFTSLPKAVAFLQSAVLTNQLLGINKVAKFDKSVAPSWVVDVLLNPTLESLAAAGWQFQGDLFPVDPAAAVSGEE